MAGQAWMKFYIGDWRRDEGVIMLSAEARGIWLELLGLMHETDHYQVTGTPIELARKCRIFDVEEMERGLSELLSTGVADFPGLDDEHPLVTQSSRLRHAEVTVKSRRRHKEIGQRVNARERKRKQRDREADDSSEVTPVSRPVTDTHAQARSDSDSTKAKEEIENIEQGVRDAASIWHHVTGYEAPALMADLMRKKVAAGQLGEWEAHAIYWRDSGYNEANVKGAVTAFLEQGEKLQKATANKAGETAEEILARYE